MAISATDVFDKVAEYVARNYQKIETLAMPYCSLTKTYPEEKEIYRVEIRIKLEEEDSPRTAIAHVDAQNGNITMFQAGHSWTQWM